jgi:tRNA threonylcarbamoyladenosine biosynthesis protein TsaB
MPIILAIETSSELASCALLVGDLVIARESSGVRTHSQAILPMVQSVLEQAAMTIKHCSAIAYGAGPGSFTGVRTACGIAQGLAFGAGLPAVPVGTLAAMALACRQRSGASEILAVLDARMGEVYWAQYRYVDGWQTVIEPTLSAPEAVQPSMLQTAAPLMACGNGFVVHQAAFARSAFGAHVQADVMPHAAQVAQLARMAFGAGAGVPAGQAQPLYLRNKIAFTSAERGAINSAKAAREAEAAEAAP